MEGMIRLGSLCSNFQGNSGANLVKFEHFGGGHLFSLKTIQVDIH